MIVGCNNAGKTTLVYVEVFGIQQVSVSDELEERRSTDGSTDRGDGVRIARRRHGGARGRARIQVPGLVLRVRPRRRWESVQAGRDAAGRRPADRAQNL